MLRISSYNCQSVNSGFPIVENLCENSDIVLLQETFLNETNHVILGTLHTDFDYAHVPATRQADVFTGRGSGGLAVLWRKSKNIKYFPLYFTNRIMGLKIIFNNTEYILINVYMNCDYKTPESIVEYKSNLADLSNIMNDENYSEIIISGDFNCDPTKGRFFCELSDFSSNHGICIYDVVKLPANSFTYISCNTPCSTSWLDHLLTSNDEIISNFRIGYDKTFVDHLPILFELATPHSQICDENVRDFKSNSERFFVQWDRVSWDQKELYASYLDYLVNDFINPGLICRDKNCNDIAHKTDIENCFEFIKKSIFSASALFLPIKQNNNAFKNRPGWNKNCKELYDIARQKFLRWVSEGKIRSGTSFDDMRSSRADFRKALNYCKKNEFLFRKQNFLHNFREGNMNRFWKDVKNINPRTNQSNTIDGISNTSKIVEFFSDTYKKILDDPQSRVGGDGSIPCEENGIIHYYFLPEFIDCNIQKINPGLGFDSIHSNHIKFTNGIFRDLLSKMFSAMLSHTFLPKEMLRGHITPIIKNGKICKTKSENYRPVMNSSMILKLFEYSIYDAISNNIKINPLQFGFTKNSSCTKAISLLKETLLSYKHSGSIVHAASIDLSKAFDKINYKILVDKLKTQNVPLTIIRIVSFMLNNTFVNVSYNGIIGKEFLVRNGVRQGGILSTLLFNLYIDECISKVSSLKVGCELLSRKVNIIGFADDLIMLSPSITGLQTILNCASPIFKYLCLNINSKKSVNISFNTKITDLFPKVDLKISDITLKKVLEIKYLGIMISNDLTLKADAERALTAFLKQFNSFYYKFNFASVDMMKFLFKTYCTSFYGISTWIEEKFTDSRMRKISVGYHKAVKRLANMAPRQSNHEACEILELNIFKHLLYKRILSHYLAIISSKSGIICKYKYYFRQQSFLKSVLTDAFSSLYGVVNFEDNDKQALYSRIDFVQRNEPRSGYNYINTDEYT